MSHDRPEISQWLADRGYSPQDVEKILQRLDSFDAKMNRDSLFDAMETGELDMDALIKDALKE
ncbi:MAG TPA: hypothetical protein VGX76_13205 [Pirellulales bacterium]|jgi:hypothetical protein|nr:hypothetical protein [Pirellulales bacterium]